MGGTVLRLPTINGGSGDVDIDDMAVKVTHETFDEGGALAP